MEHDHKKHDPNNLHEDHSGHNSGHHSEHKDAAITGRERLWLSTSTTFHCLIGCGLGEVAGMIIGTGLGMSNVKTIVLAVLLGFFFGFLLGIVPLLRAGFSFGRALKQVFIAESLSIAVMETAEVLVQVYTPGVMEAGLSSAIFWIGMGLSLIAGFIAAWPINYILIGKGISHQH
ncbi:hypothetical protein LCGC14_1909790 [marine sediment metagenome]|uniref:DUF4396 domain-containing protein n=1 Tax=marine sediment metagenome TaxID=412755 RepID=A0A0F9I7Y6_9ZZZZ